MTITLKQLCQYIILQEKEIGSYFGIFRTNLVHGNVSITVDSRLRS